MYRCESLPVFQLRMIEEFFEPMRYTAVHIIKLDLILLQEEVVKRVSRFDFINMNEGNLLTEYNRSVLSKGETQLVVHRGGK